MRRLLKFTVATAVELDLIDLAVQAVDGTKGGANAAGDRTYDAAGLHRLLERTEAAIAELEAQNEGGDDPLPPRLPEELRQAHELRHQVRDAMCRLAHHQTMSKVNLTDADAQLMKARSGIIIDYNAQAMVSPLNPNTAKGSGMLITAAEVVNTAADSGQLVPMLEQAEELTGERALSFFTDMTHLEGRLFIELTHPVFQVIDPPPGRTATRYVASLVQLACEDRQRPGEQEWGASFWPGDTFSRGDAVLELRSGCDPG